MSVREDGSERAVTVTFSAADVDVILTVTRGLEGMAEDLPADLVAAMRSTRTTLQAALRNEGDATWHSEIMRAGVDGLHANDCWDSDDHQDCRDIVFAVLSGLAEAGYRLVKP